MESFEACRMLGAHLREGTHELDREVACDCIEEASVLLRRRMEPLPADLDDGDDMAAEPDRHGDEAGKRRHELCRQLVRLVRLLIYDLTAGRASGPEIGCRRCQDTEAQRML